MKRRVLSFLAGAAAALALTALTATALAASGQVQFNVAGVALNGETKIAAGSDIIAPNGRPGMIGLVFSWNSFLSVSVCFRGTGPRPFYQLNVPWAGRIPGLFYLCQKSQRSRLFLWSLTVSLPTAGSAGDRLRSLRGR